MIDNIVPERDLEEVTQVYAKVFAGPPWNEHTRCPNEDKFFGRDTKPGDNCPSCSDGILEVAYPADSTSKKILKEISRPKAVGLIKRDKDDRIVGFSWGYAYQSPLEFAQDKYPAFMHDTIEKILTSNSTDGELYYLSETGIVDEFRGKGLTNEFYFIRLQLARSYGLPVVVRTNYESPIIAVTQKFGFRQIMGPRAFANKERTEIIVTDELVNGYRDEHNPSRVLLVLDKRDEAIGLVR